MLSHSKIPALQPLFRGEILTVLNGLTGAPLTFPALAPILKIQISEALTEDGRQELWSANGHSNIVKIPAIEETIRGIGDESKFKNNPSTEALRSQTEGSLQPPLRPSSIA